MFLKMKISLYNAWRIWAKSLGAKASPDNKEANQVAMIRTFQFLFFIATPGLCIIYNTFR